MSVSIDVAYPFAGRWLVQNSPADRVPSHGTEAFASAFAIDFVPVGRAGRSAPFTFTSLVRPEPAEVFPGFGRPILAPVAGTVVAVHDGEEDHPAFRGLPSVGYALTQERRAAGGWRALAGNHVLIAVDVRVKRGSRPEHATIPARDHHRGGTIVALCHLQHGSTCVHPGQRVELGEMIGRCGNSGNSTEPHVHVQAIDRADVSHAEPVRLTFEGTLPFNGEVVEA